MSAIDQYLELFREHRALVDGNSCEPLNALRVAAAGALTEHPLPTKGSEDYEDTDLDAMLAPDYGINLQRVNIDVNAEVTFRCDVPVMNTGYIAVNNDIYSVPDDVRAKLPEGVEIYTLREIGEKDPTLLSNYYGNAADLSNPIVALDTLFAQDGLFIRIKRGVRLEQPLQIVNILSAGVPMMAVRRMLIVAEEDSEAKILVCDHTQRADVALAALETVEIFLDRNARIDYYNLEESEESTNRLSALYVIQREHSQANVDGITLYNGTTRNEYYCRLEGEEAGLRLYGMGIEDKHRKVSTFTRIDHLVPRCKSDELFKFSLDEEAHGEFTGRIYVAPGAVKTEAYQANRNLVATDTAKMMSKPQLEIYNDDVKCSHGCAIGQLDPLQVFYMRTRGLDEHQAKQLLRQAFMADVIAAVDVQPLRERLTHLVERRFSGSDSACAGCKLNQNQL